MKPVKSSKLLLAMAGWVGSVVMAVGAVNFVSVDMDLTTPGIQSNRAATSNELITVGLVLTVGPPTVRLPESLATHAGFPGTGCYFYSAVFAELLRVASGFEGAMVHEKCRGRGDDHCFWRAAEAGGYE